MLERVAEMVTQVMDANGWVLDDFISIIFTATTDLVSEFPAYAARMLGFTDVPLICTRELEIEGSMPRVVRMMAHVETDLPRADITHVYLHGAAALRRDLTRVREVRDDADVDPVIVVVAVPPDHLAEQVVEALRTTRATVTDVGSVKGAPLAAVRHLAPDAVARYVGSH